MEKFKPNDKINRIKNSVGFVNWKTDDYHYDEIKRVCKELGKKLIVAEGIPYNQMPEFYNKLETFISLPPSCTGFNNSWVEAMACDVPKIIGNKYGIGHELPIYYVDENMSLSEAIMLAKERKYRDWVKNVYNIKKQIDKILGVFKDERG